MTRAMAVLGALALLAGPALPSPAGPGPMAAQEGSAPAEGARAGSARAANTADTQAGTLDRSAAELDDLTARVADQLRCPVCRNQSVLESSSTLAREMQAEIRRRLARGDTPEEVRAYFVSRYGEWILLQPPAHGINLLVYVLPALALLVGAWVVVRLVRGWTSGEGTAAAGAEAGGARADGPAGAGTGTGAREPDDGLSPEEERRLEEAMGRDAGTSRSHGR